jgi:hypothetical protein
MSGMGRREFAALLVGAAAAWPLAARAQQAGETRRIAILMGTATTELGKSYLATFVQRLDQLGWANGRNARIETRWWTGTVDGMRPVVTELVAFSPDVIMAFSNPAVALLKRMASTRIWLPSRASSAQTCISLQVTVTQPISKNSWSDIRSFRGEARQPGAPPLRGSSYIFPTF